MFEPLDFHAQEPLYRQLSQRIENLIARGDLALGAHLPTVRELADELGINFNTVARAYRDLSQQGDLVSMRGRGTFVAQKSDRSATTPDDRDQLVDLTREYVTSARMQGHRSGAILSAVEVALHKGKE